MERQEIILPTKIIAVSKSFSDKIDLLKSLITQHCDVISLTCSDVDKTVLAYYLMGGVNRQTNFKLVREQFTHLTPEIAKQSVYNARLSLKKKGIISYNKVRAVFIINEPFNTIDFSAISSVTYAVTYLHENNK